MVKTKYDKKKQKSNHESTKIIPIRFNKKVKKKSTIKTTLQKAETRIQISRQLNPHFLHNNTHRMNVEVTALNVLSKISSKTKSVKYILTKTKQQKKTSWSKIL